MRETSFSDGSGPWAGGSGLGRGISSKNHSEKKVKRRLSIPPPFGFDSQLLDSKTVSARSTQQVLCSGGLAFPGESGILTL